MIIDKIENAHLYYCLGEDIKIALQALEKYTELDVKEPKTTIVSNESSDIYLTVSEYETQDASTKLWETHRKYIDVQYIKKGAESMGYTSLDRLKVAVPYNPDTDCEFHTGNGQFIEFNENNFMIFFPTDAHLPCIKRDNRTSSVTKYVVKVRT